MDGSIAISLVMAVAAASGCISSGGVYDVSLHEGRSIIDDNRGNPDFVILDVRTPEEYSAGHIEGAVLLDFEADDFKQKADGLPRQKTYIVYCRSGRRSAEAVNALSGLGFRDLHNMRGGITEWKAEGYPTVS
ncbi:MAG: rhodanese-like domain-containing protein [Candidatus Altiarchaeota archaeon]